MKEEWDRCSPWLAEALDLAGNTHTLDDVLRAICDPSGNTHFWPHPTACLVTEFVHYPRMKALNFWLGGGRLAGLLELRPIVETWGAEQGCTRMQGVGRPGFSKKLSGEYRPLAVMLVKDVERTLQ